MSNLEYVVAFVVLGLVGIYFMFSKLHTLFPKLIELDFLTDAQSRKIYNKLGPETHQLIEQIESLGFERLGVRYERPRPALHKIFSIGFSSKKAGAFASILLSRNKVASFYFLTYFTNGAVIFTSNKPGSSPVDSDDCRYGGLLGGSPAELLEAHKQRLEDFCRRGYQPAQDFSRAGRDESTRVFYRNPTLSKKFRMQGLVFILQALIMAGIAVAVLIDISNRQDKPKGEAGGVEQVAPGDGN